MFNQVGAEALSILLAGRIDDDPDPSQMLFNVGLGRLIDELQQAVRRELGVDRVPLHGPAVTSRTPSPGESPAAA